MQQPPPFGHEQIFTEIIRRVLDTVTVKPPRSPERGAAAKQAAVCSVMAFNPRDPVEAMLAGQCVVYDHLLHDGAKDLLEGMTQELVIRARPGVLAAGKMFLGTLGMLVRMQRRPEAQLAFGRPLPEPTPEPVAEPVAVPVAAEENSHRQPDAAPVDPSPIAAHREAPSPDPAAEVRPAVQPRPSASPTAAPSTPIAPGLAPAVRASVVPARAEPAFGGSETVAIAEPVPWSVRQDAVVREAVDAMLTGPREPLLDYGDPRLGAECAASVVRSVWGRSEPSATDPATGSGQAPPARSVTKP